MISFIVPVRNDAVHLARCLASIHASAGSLPHEIIVVDNGSDDDSAAVARAAGARVMELPGLRVAELRNAAARTASGPILAFIDADHEIDRGWSAAAIALLEDPSVWAVGAQYHAPSEGTWVQTTYDGLRRREPGCQAASWLPSGNLAVRRDRFEAVGGFDASLETCEDVDLCQRLRNAGGRLLSADRLKSVHRGDPSTLKALFLGELWRGRDNLRVSLRAPLSLETAPSVALPVANLFGLAAVLGGVMTWRLGGWRLALCGIVMLVALSFARTIVVLRSKRRRSAADAIRTAVVAAVYDAARALALVSPGGHALRRKS
jgi:hypothetical protein